MSGFALKQKNPELWWPAYIPSVVLVSIVLITTSKQWVDIDTRSLIAFFCGIMLTGLYFCLIPITLLIIYREWKDGIKVEWDKLIFIPIMSAAFTFFCLMPSLILLHPEITLDENFFEILRIIF
jgi:hypothetical protein